MGLLHRNTAHQMPRLVEQKQGAYNKRYFSKYGQFKILAQSTISFWKDEIYGRYSRLCIHEKNSISRYCFFSFLL